MVFRVAFFNRLHSWAVIRRLSAAVAQGYLWKSGKSAESFEKVDDQGVEIGIAFPEILDLPDGMNHG
jgi:hypothetical protein